MKLWLLCMLLIVSSMEANAFVETPYITPAQPTPDDPISVHVRMGGCHGSYDAVDGATLEMSVPGELRLITLGDALHPGDPFCNAPDFGYRFDIGTLPEGRYTLRFFIRDELSGAGLVEFGSVTFVVAVPARIPSTGHWASALLVTGVVLIATVGNRYSRA